MPPNMIEIHSKCLLAVSLPVSVLFVSSLLSYFVSTFVLPSLCFRSQTIMVDEE